MFTGCAMHANVFDFSQMLASSKEPYVEFLRVPSMSVGMYVLDAGASDQQKPHSEDEVYYVAGGQAKMRTGSDGNARTFEVGPGTIIFVPARLQHSFCEISERLSVVVFFAPAEGSAAVAAQ